MVGAIIAFLKLYQIAIIIRAVASWFGVDERQSWLKPLMMVTEPILAPLRTFTRFGNIDASPIVVIIAIQVVILLLGR